MGFGVSPSQTVDVQVLRAFKKHVLRPYRLLFNALNASLAEFTATLVKGKETTTTLSNLVLQSFSLRDWTATLGLDKAAYKMLSRRLDRRVQAHKVELVGLLGTLRGIVRDMRAALDAFREDAWTGLVDCDAQCRELLSDVVMCERGSLTYRQVCGAVEGMVWMCEREVEEVKALVVDDFVDACGRYRGAGIANTGDVDRLMARAYWELRIVAWVTELYLERDKVERNMSAMAADAGLPYFTSNE